MTYRTHRPVRYPSGGGYPSVHVAGRDDVTRILRPYDPDATAVIPVMPSYPPVEVLENSSSIPGLGYETDMGEPHGCIPAWLGVLLLVALVADASALALIVWILR